MGLIEFGEQCVAYPHLTRDLRLLELRRRGAMRAGANAALAKVADRPLSQQWSQYFYDNPTFFNDITNISGKLRPFIKRSKPEKKQKIEEELRKIKVEVGVYLPSNPEGVVIGEEQLRVRAI